MIAAIINNNRNILKNSPDGMLLWTASLFFPHIIFSSDMLRLYNTVERINTLDENNKYKLLRQVVPLVNDNFTALDIDELHSTYKAILKKKHKSGPEILRMKKTGRTIEDLVIHYIYYATEEIKDLNFIPIIDLNEVPEDKFIDFNTRACDLAGNVRFDGMKESVLRVLKESEVIPIFSRGLPGNDFLSRAKISDNLMQNTIMTSEEPIIEFPAPELLNDKELKELRGELLEKLSPLHSHLKKISELLRSASADSLPESSAGQLMTDLYHQKDYFNRTINECHHIKFLAGQKEKTKKYAVYPGIATLNKLLDIYTQMNILNREQGNTILNDLKNEINPENCCLFMIIDAAGKN